MKIEIEKGRVFVEGKETVDPVLIGYAVLDYAENCNVDLSAIKEKYHAYIKERNHRKTYERETLIDLMVSKNITTAQDLAVEAKKIFISQATCYNFFGFLKASGIADFTNYWK
jgi:thiamine biosynthesis protein ThiC